MRVVRLLQEMKGKLESEKKSDEELEQKRQCWCETTQTETNTAIDNAKAKDLSLVQSIESLAAQSATLKVEIATIQKELTSEQDALKTMDELRRKQQGEFRADEKDMVEAMTNLKNAIQVLSKHHEEALLQKQPELVSGLTSVLRRTVNQYSRLLDMDVDLSTTTHPRTAFLSLSKSATTDPLVAAVTESFRTGSSSMPEKFATQLVASIAKRDLALLQTTPNAGSYSSQSSEIFGILNSMADEFKKKLDEDRKLEATRAAEFAELKSTKSKMISDYKAQLITKKASKSAADKSLADDKEDLEDTRTQLSADTKFLGDVRLQCQDADTEWAQRSKTRNEEILAVAETIAILNSDDSKEQFDKSLNSFVQMKLSSNKERRVRERLAKLLKSARAKVGSKLTSLLQIGGPDLSALEVSVQLDAFTKVKEAIDQMVDELQKTQALEVQEKDFCVSEGNTNARSTQDANHKKADLTGKAEALEADINLLGEEITQLQSENADLRVEIKKASENREAANAEFQTSVNDQRATQGILKKALLRMEKFYGKAMLMQSLSKDGPMPTQSEYKKQSGSTSILSMLDMIIKESQQLEKESVAAETEAQATYESFVSNSNASIKGKQGEITAKTELRADKGKALVDTNTDIEYTSSELQQLASYKAQLNTQCSFLLKNFDVRQSARTNEMEALRQAKSILSGALQ